MKTHIALFAAFALVVMPVTAPAAPTRPSDAIDPSARAIANQTMRLQDRDGDGRISLKESAGAALALFYTIDADTNGLISTREMTDVATHDVTALRISTTQAQTEALVQARFQVMDMDQDHQISLAEMMAVNEAIFNAADTNEDGYISRDELLAAAMQHAR